MDLWNWILQNLHVQDWGVTPSSLMAPLALVALIVIAGRIARRKGPSTESRDIAGGVLITVIIGAAFFWIFAGIGLLQRTFH